MSQSDANHQRTREHGEDVKFAILKETTWEILDSMSTCLGLSFQLSTSEKTFVSSSVSFPYFCSIPDSDDSSEVRHCAAVYSCLLRNLSVKNIFEEWNALLSPICNCTWCRLYYNFCLLESWFCKSRKWLMWQKKTFKFHWYCIQRF